MHRSIKLYYGASGVVMACFLCLLASCTIYSETRCTYEIVSVTPPLSDVSLLDYASPGNVEMLPPLAMCYCKNLLLHISDDSIRGQRIERVEAVGTWSTREVPPGEKRESSFLLQEIPVDCSDALKIVRLYMYSDVSHTESVVTIRLTGECSTWHTSVQMAFAMGV